MAASPSVLLWSAVRIYRDGLVDALTRDTRIGSVEAVVDAVACRDAAQARRPAVVVVDVSSPGAVDVARELHETGVGVVALGIQEHESDILAFAEAGVAAYHTREQTLDQLVGAVLAVGRGEAQCSPRITAMLVKHMAGVAGGRATRAAVLDAPAVAALTRREAEVLDLLGDGLTNQQIALRLSIELPTVKNHVHNILDKLGARSRAQAVAIGRA